MFLRNTKGVLWLCFLLLILLIQSGAMFIWAHHRYENISLENIPAVIGVLQFAVVIYFISMFVIRFAFPAFSLEKHSAWLIRSAPINLWRVFLGKLLFYSVLFGILGVLFAFLNRAAIQFSFPIGALFFTVVVTATTAITSFGLGLGALFPNFETDDPEVLSTTLPGLVFIFCSLFYGGAVAFALQRFLIQRSAYPLVIIFLLSFVVIGCFSYFPRYILRRLEF